MRIAIDADLIGQNRSGNEVFLRGIVKGLANVLDPGRVTLLLSGSRVDNLSSVDAGRLSAEFVRTPAGLWGDLRLGVALTRARADWVIASYNAPLRFHGRIATVIHDVSFRRVPETFPKALRLRLEASVIRSIRKSDVILTVSKFSRDELYDIYPSLLRGKEIVVVPDAPGRHFRRDRIDMSATATVRERYCLPAKFVLAVGNLQPRKNVVRIVAAAKLAEVPLVVVGRPIWRNRVPRELVGDDSVHWLGYVPELDLPPLMASAAVFLYPSLYEGFGLPIVEAMSAGAPVITSDRGAMREVAGGGALLVDPYDVTGMARAVRKIVEEEGFANCLRERGQLRAAEFGWDNSAAILAGALNLPLAISGPGAVG